MCLCVSENPRNDDVFIEFFFVFHQDTHKCWRVCHCVRVCAAHEVAKKERTNERHNTKYIVCSYQCSIWMCTSVYCVWLRFAFYHHHSEFFAFFLFFLFRFEQFYYFLLLLCFARPSKSDTRTKTTKKERKNTHEIRRSVCTVDWLDRKVKKTSESNKTKPKNTQINKFRISDKWKLKIKNWYRTRSVCCTLTIVYFDCVKPEEENEIIVCGIGGACWTSIRLSEAANWCTLRQRATPSTVRVVARNDFFGQMQIKV